MLPVIAAILNTEGQLLSYNAFIIVGTVYYTFHTCETFSNNFKVSFVVNSGM